MKKNPMDAGTPASATDHPGQEIPTYYGRPAIRPSLYGWIVAAYIYIGGLAAGLQIVVTAAQLLALPGSAELAFIGRAIVLALTSLGGPLLIIDLHTPQRFYNMLRIFRPTSPMSIGTYVLMGFGFWSLAAFVLHAFGLDLLALICGCLAAVMGWMMTTYTAALLAATATPLWAAAPRLLAVRYAASALATGAAAACLIALGTGPTPGMARAFGNLAAVALLIEFVASIGHWRTCRRIGVNGPLQERPLGPIYLVGVQGTGIVISFALFILGNFIAPHLAFALPASVIVLAGGFLMRGLIMLAGNESARRPVDYFRFAQG
jgi:protein NrfD